MYYKYGNYTILYKYGTLASWWKRCLHYSFRKKNITTGGQRCMLYYGLLLLYTVK